AGDSYTVQIADTVHTSDGLPIAAALSIAFTTVAPSEPDWTTAAPIDGTNGAYRPVNHGDATGVLCVFVQRDALNQRAPRGTRWTAAGGWSAPDAVPTSSLRADDAVLRLDGNDVGQCVLRADTTIGLRSVAFAPAGGWSVDQDAGLLP